MSWRTTVLAAVACSARPFGECDRRAAAWRGRLRMAIVSGLIGQAGVLGWRGGWPYRPRVASWAADAIDLRFKTVVDKAPGPRLKGRPMRPRALLSPVVLAVAVLMLAPRRLINHGLEPQVNGIRG